MLNKIIILLTVILVCVIVYYLVFSTENFDEKTMLEQATSQSKLLDLLFQPRKISPIDSNIPRSNYEPDRSTKTQVLLSGEPMMQSNLNTNGIITTYDDKIKNVNDELVSLVAKLNNNPTELEIQNNNINYLLSSFVSSNFFQKSQKEIFEKDLSGLFSLLHLLDEKNKKLLVSIIDKMMNLGTSIKYILTPMYKKN
jgi:hypothetical protein